MKIFTVPSICLRCKHLYLGLTCDEDNAHRFKSSRSEVKVWELLYLRHEAGIDCGCNFDWMEGIDNDFNEVDSGHQEPFTGKWIPTDPPTCEVFEPGEMDTYCPRWIVKKTLELCSNQETAEG